MCPDALRRSHETPLLGAGPTLSTFLPLAPQSQDCAKIVATSLISVSALDVPLQTSSQHSLKRSEALSCGKSYPTLPSWTVMSSRMSQSDTGGLQTDVNSRPPRHWAEASFCRGSCGPLPWSCWISESLSTIFLQWKSASIIPKHN